MAFCGNCGTQAQDGVKFCPSCGTVIGEASAGQASQQGYAPGAPLTDEARDAQENKTMGILAYILFFIPILTSAHKTSPFVRFHTNQGTVLWLSGIAYSVVSGILSAVIRVRYDWGFGVVTYHTPGWLSTILWLISIPIFVFAVMGLVSAVQGKKKELPIIGKFKLFK